MIFKVTLRSGTIVVSPFKTFMNFSGISFFILENSEIQSCLGFEKKKCQCPSFLLSIRTEDQKVTNHNSKTHTPILLLSFFASHKPPKITMVKRRYNIYNIHSIYTTQTVKVTTKKCRAVVTLSSKSSGRNCSVIFRYKSIRHV